MRLTDEYKDRFESPRGGRIHSGAAAYAGQKNFTTHTICPYCKKKNHTAQDCFDNPNSKKFKGRKKVTFSKGFSNNFKISRIGTKPRLAMAISKRLGKYSIGENVEFIIDSGASNHMCFEEPMFTFLEANENCEITLGDQSTVFRTKKGIIDIKMCSEDNPENRTWMRLTNVLYVPDLRMNLISVSALDKHNVGLIIGRRRCRLFDLKTMK